MGAVVVGHTTSIILLCSHFHQVEGDLAAGKMSPLVRLGPRRGTQVSPLFHLARQGPGKQAPVCHQLALRMLSVSWVV